MANVEEAAERGKTKTTFSGDVVRLEELERLPAHLWGLGHLPDDDPIKKFKHRGFLEELGKIKREKMGAHPFSLLGSEHGLGKKIILDFIERELKKLSYDVVFDPKQNGGAGSLEVDWS